MSEFKAYELVRENGAWHVYSQTGNRITSKGFETKQEAKDFCMHRDLLRACR